MRKKLLSAIMLLSAVILSTAAQNIPTLKKVGHSTCLVVNGKPLVMRSGELHNSTASSLEYMRENRVMERMAAMNLIAYTHGEYFDVTNPAGFFGWSVRKKKVIKREKK